MSEQDNPPADGETNDSGISLPAMPLTLAAAGQQVILVRVQGGHRFQHRLAEMGLTPGVRFRVVSRGGGPFIVSLKDARLILGRGMVPRIFVRPT